MSNDGKRLGDHLAQSYIVPASRHTDNVSGRHSIIAAALGQLIPAGDHQYSQSTRADSVLIGDA